MSPEIPKKSVGCIVPARNEAGHLITVIDHILQIPQINEIVIVEGGSTDNTLEVASQIAASNTSKIRVTTQTGTGKFNAVLEGSKICKSDFLVIWDADGTISAADSVRIILTALESNSAATGNRLRGHMEKGSMRFANKIGNWFFAILWIPILKMKPIDLLCGTKIFPREVFEELPSHLIKVDPYGDFALLAGAKSVGLKISSVTVDYDARKYGQTNIRRWSGGLMLLLTTLRIVFWFLGNSLRRRTYEK